MGDNGKERTPWNDPQVIAVAESHQRELDARLIAASVLRGIRDDQENEPGIFGITKAELAKTLIGFALMGLVAFVGWMLVVRDTVNNAITKEQIQKIMLEHASAPHPGVATQEQVHKLETGQRLLEQAMGNLTDSVDKLSNVVLKMRRTQKRNHRD